MRPIDADKLLTEIKTLPIMSNWGEAFLPQLVQEQPTVDAVEVVRCKDCRYYDECTNFLFDDDYCSRGERKMRLINFECDTCIFYPPSSCDGKPCCFCDTSEPELNCYKPKIKED